MFVRNRPVRIDCFLLLLVAHQDGSLPILLVLTHNIGASRSSLLPVLCSMQIESRVAGMDRVVNRLVHLDILHADFYGFLSTLVLGVSSLCWSYFLDDLDIGRQIRIEDTLG